MTTHNAVKESYLKQAFTMTRSHIQRLLNAALSVAIEMCDPEYDAPSLTVDLIDANTVQVVCVMQSTVIQNQQARTAEVRHIINATLRTPETEPQFRQDQIDDDFDPATDTRDFRIDVYPNC